MHSDMQVSSPLGSLTTKITTMISLEKTFSHNNTFIQFYHSNFTNIQLGPDKKLCLLIHIIYSVVNRIEKKCIISTLPKERRGSKSASS